MNIASIETKARGAYKTLVANDLLKAAVTVFLTTLGTALYKFFGDNESLPTWTEFKPYLMTALVAGGSVLLKNYFTNSDGQLLKKENTNVIVAQEPDVLDKK